MKNLKLINLDSVADYYFELHRADCQDVSKKKGIVYEVASIEEAKDFIEGDNENYETSWSIDEHCKIFGCVDKVGA